MEPWTVTLTRGKGRSSTFRVRTLVLALPLLLALGAVLLVAGPWNRWPPEPDRTSEEIVPLNARDPANLVMSPYWGKCRGECPSISKPGQGGGHE